MISKNNTSIGRNHLKQYYHSNITNGRSVSHEPRAVSLKYMSVRNELVQKIKDNSREKSAMSKDQLN